MPPRPKRPANPIDYSADALNRSGAGLAPSKRPKFDARNPHLAAPDAPETETDIFLEADEGAIGKRRVHRNAVELEGYETDSSEEGFNATRKQWAREDKGSGKAKAKAKDDGDDDDMFGGDNDEVEELDRDADRGGIGRKDKNVKFLEMDDIEGQEEEGIDDQVPVQRYPDIFKDERRDGSESSEDDEEKLAEEGLDEEVGAGGRKSHAPKREGFNMKSEMEEGRFDETGNYIRKAAEKDAIHDSWLTGIRRKDMKKAKEAMEKREAERREQMRQDDAILTSEVLGRLIPCLDRGESILEALARLGKAKKKQDTNKNKNQWRQKKKAAAADDDMEVDKPKGKEADDPAEVQRKEMVERITEAADILLTRGQPEVYDETRESLMRQYRRETGEDWVDPKPVKESPSDINADTRKWEYRWTDARDDGSTYGPFGSAEMKSWNEHGFFGEGVEFRLVDGMEGWTRAPGFA
jgi:CD2 antigen cytoplasmic tail-binding protein 2